MIISLEKNEVGRDFVVGDLHGSFEAFNQLLTYVDFDEQRDRVIAVGDLIDRGQDSLICLELLLTPWFYSVRGNHETWMLEWFLASEGLRPDIERQWREEGGTWFFSLAPEQQFRCVRLIEPLPLVIIVESGGYQYTILHAEIPPEVGHFQTFIDRLVNGDRQTVYSCLRGRRRKRARSAALVGGIDYILSGHSPSYFPRIRHGNSLIIDFGAGSPGYKCGLGLMELASQRLYIHSQNDIRTYEATTFI